MLSNCLRDMDDCCSGTSGCWTQHCCPNVLPLLLSGVNLRGRNKETHAVGELRQPLKSVVSQQLTSAKCYCQRLCLIPVLRICCWSVEVRRLLARLRHRRLRVDITRSQIGLANRQSAQSTPSPGWGPRGQGPSKNRQAPGKIAGLFVLKWKKDQMATLCCVPWRLEQTAESHSLLSRLSRA